MNILIIPDVHGRTFWQQVGELIDNYDKIIFLGDYLDPYIQENINWDMTIAQFKAILKFREEHPEKVILLCGNHDLHYIVNKDLNCSRYNVRESSKVNELCKGVPFKVAYKIDNYLFTHAGITKNWLNDCDLTVTKLLESSPEEIYIQLCIIGMLRGGWKISGSCVWCDIGEFRSCKHDIGYYQIFGHTQLINEHISEDYACLDCKKCFELDTNTKIIKSI